MPQRERPPGNEIPMTTSRQAARTHSPPRGEWQKVRQPTQPGAFLPGLGRNQCGMRFLARGTRPYGRPRQGQPGVAPLQRSGVWAAPGPSLRSGKLYGAVRGQDMGFKGRRPNCGNKRTRQCGKRINPVLPARNRKRSGAGLVSITTPTRIPRNNRGLDVKGRGRSLLGGGFWPSVPNSTTTPRPGRCGEILRASPHLFQHPTEPIDRTVPITPPIQGVTHGAEPL
jgi:hypothetical protein